MVKQFGEWATDILKNHVLTISTICGLILIYVRIFKPDIFGDVSQIVAQYLIMKRD